MSDNAKRRREREKEAISEGRIIYAHEEVAPGLLRHGDDTGLDLCNFLEASHRREDAIRALCENWLHEEKTAFDAMYGIVKILDGDV